MCSIDEAQSMFIKKFNLLMYNMMPTFDCDSVVNKAGSKVNINKNLIKSCIFKEDVKLCINAYRGIIFTELDKNTHTWSVMCETHYKKKMIENFGIGVKQYERIENSADNIKLIV